ncbi:MAG: protein translocase subunit SecF [Clostridia bacterium]|nr:protein translocase subunit SecF [Clostridia bacterium]MBQ7897783.1 protein translocase subunit SecF [Clostridia bacterium]
MKFISKEQMEITGLRKVWFTISAIVLIAALLFIFVKGFNLDTDFAGGLTLQYDLHKTLDKAELDKVRSLVDSVDGITVNTIQKSGDNSSCVIIKAADAAPEVMDEVYNVLNIAYGAALPEEDDEKTLTEEELEELLGEETDEATEETAEETTEETTEEVTEETTEAVDDAEAEVEAQTETEGEAEAETETEAEPEAETSEEEEIVYGGTVPVEILAESRIGASISGEIKRSAFIATIIAVILMLLYITVRFEFRSAIAAILCLIHDIILVIATYSVLGIPVSSNIIAAILTILGYSINATIVLFDRVRENKRKMSKTDFGVIINISSRQTVMRSINTTITTLLTIGMVYILGVHSIKEFALPLIVGIVAGLYSSVFLSGSFWYTLTPKKK